MKELRQYLDLLSDVADARDVGWIAAEVLKESFIDECRIDLVDAGEEELMCALCTEKILETTVDEVISGIGPWFLLLANET